MRWIFLWQYHSEIRRIAGYVTDFRVVLPEKKTSNIKSYFLTVPKIKNSPASLLRGLLTYIMEALKISSKMEQQAFGYRTVFQKITFV